MNKNLPVDNIAETSIPFPSWPVLFFLTAEMFSNHCLQNKIENLRTERSSFMMCLQRWMPDPAEPFSRPDSLFAVSLTHWSFSSLSFPKPFSSYAICLSYTSSSSPATAVLQFHFKDTLLWEVCPRCPPATLVLPSSWLFLSSIKAFPVAQNNEVYSVSDLPLCLFG